MRISGHSAAIAVFVTSLALVVALPGPASAAPPVPSSNITCAKLASATNPVAAFPTAVTQRYAAISELPRNPILPGAEIIKTAGGLVCEWSNGVALDGGVPGSTAVGVLVEYLPFASSGYWRWAAIGGTTTPESFFCGSGYCQLASSAGGDFLIVGIQGSISDAVAADLAYRISTALQLGANTPFISPPYAAILGPTCEEVVRPVVWRAAVGAVPPLSTRRVPPGWTPVHSAMVIARAPACAYIDAGSRRSAGLLSTMPGGQWSFIRLRTFLTTPGPLTPITVPGMLAGDTAYTRCDVAHNQCILDALIATHWVQVNLYPRGTGVDLIRADRLAAMSPILSEIVLQIYSP